MTAITNVYQVGGKQNEDPVHPFRKHFEELQVGDTVITHKHTVTEADISNFANVSGDNFYAHMDDTSLEGTIFEQRVAHGYFVLSKAAGLFVDPKKRTCFAQLWNRRMPLYQAGLSRHDHRGKTDREGES